MEHPYWLKRKGRERLAVNATPTYDFRQSPSWLLAALKDQQKGDGTSSKRVMKVFLKHSLVMMTRERVKVQLPSIKKRGRGRRRGGNCDHGKIYREADKVPTCDRMSHDKRNTSR